MEQLRGEEITASIQNPNQSRQSRFRQNRSQMRDPQRITINHQRILSITHHQNRFRDPTNAF